MLPLLTTINTASAAPVLDWTPQKPIPGYENERPPHLIADQNNKVHAFNSQSIAEFSAGIFYRRWSPDTGWTRAVDILIPGIAPSSALQAVSLDHRGIFHLVYFAGTDTSGEIYYTYAYASEAAYAQEWAKPVLIGEKAGPIAQASLTIVNETDLIVLFTGSKTGTGIYMTVSNDLGDTWSETALAFPVLGKERLPTSINTISDEIGQLHVVWSVVNEIGLGEEVNYSRLDSSFETWSKPIRLASKEGNDYSTNWPSIVNHDNKLIVIYQDSLPATRFMRISSDNGETWEKPIRPFPHTGEYEHAVMVKDSSDTLHMLMGNRLDNPEIHGMWHTTWSGTQWLPLEPVVTGPLTSEFDPSAPKAVISQGNTLLVAWWNNVPDAEVPYFSYNLLDTPELPAVPLATPIEKQENNVVADASETPMLTPTPVPIPEFEQDGVSTTSNPTVPLFFGLVPVLVLIVGFFVYIHNSKSHTT